MIISSKDNELIKEVCKLKEKKYRDEKNLYFVEGIKIIEEALEEKVEIRKVFVREDVVNNIEIKEIINFLDKDKVVYVTENVFKVMTDVSNPQGILAVIEKKKLDDKDINYDTRLTLILDDIQDPGNMGTIIRTADSLGLKQIIVSSNTVDIYNPKVLRSTMGAIFRINIIRVKDLVNIIDELKKNNIKVYATDLKESNSIYNVDFDKSAIIIGNEANGVSQKVLDNATKKIKIPMIGKTESLNAAVATSIILYEAYRKLGLLK